MASESDRSNGLSLANDAAATDIHTPIETEVLAPVQASHMTLPSTEEPGSPIDPNASFRTEANTRPDFVIPSSMTPPPLSQKILPGVNPDALDGCDDVVMSGVPIASGAVSFLGSQRSHPFSPPATGGNTKRTRTTAIAGEYTVPTKVQIEAASADELREMLNNCAADHSRIKMEVAHHKFRLNLVSLQAADDAERAAVEHEMALREVETLRNDQNIRQARRDLSSAADSTHAKYLELKMAYDDAMDDIADLCKKLKTAKKVIRQHQDEVSMLRECRSQLLTRIRENREHFNMLRSPGGLLHSALPPTSYAQSAKNLSQATGQSRSVSTKNARGSSSSSSRPTQQEQPNQEPLAALLQALEKNSAPSTPVAPVRPSARTGPKHTRNVQSLSALPTTPMSHMPRGPDQPALLPSIDLVPQTEPPRRYTAKPSFSSSQQRSRSRESTISVPDNNDPEDLARRAMNSFMSRSNNGGLGTHGSQSMSAAAPTAAASQQPHIQNIPRSSVPSAVLDAQMLMSQASQAATEMLCMEARTSQERNEPVTERATMQLHAKMLSPSPSASAHLHSHSHSHAHSHSHSHSHSPLPPLPLPLPPPQQSQMSGPSPSTLTVPVPVPMGAAAEKRKFSEGLRPDPLRDILASPLKKARVDGSAGDVSRAGLGPYEN